MRSFSLSLNTLKAKFTAFALLFAAFAVSTVNINAQKIKAPVKKIEAQSSAQTVEAAQLKLTSIGQTDVSDKVSDSEADAVSVASSYTFATSTTGSLTDMSSGTTTLLAANVDDTPSPLTNIGFDFYFQAARYTQFSVNENGVVRLGAAAQTSTPYQPLAQAGLPIITAYGADQRTHAGDGKVHFKVTGTVGSRVLIIEWLNNQSNFNTGGTADLTYQVRLYETTGVIEFAYGSMTLSTNGAADPNSQDPQIGFSSSNTAGTVGSVTAAQSGTPAPTFNGASATPTNNLYTAGTIPVLTSAADGSRRTFSFTPPTPTTASNLTFAAVTPVSYTLNWVDAPDEQLYSIFRSTDGVNYTFFATTAQNITTLNATGLNPSTTYFWQVFSVSEGAINLTPISGTQATAAPGNISCNGAGGNWSATATWSGGAIPTAADNVTIQSGCIVTIDIASNTLSLNVQNGGVLQYETTTARTLTVSSSLMIDTGGTFQSAATGTVTTHVLSVGTDLINNGTLDFSTNANTAGAGITFTGAASNTFSGTGATTDIRAITVNKGTSNANILELTTTNFTVQGAVIDSATANYLTLTNGTFKISGTFTAAFRTFAVAAYTIPSTAGIWLNNPNYTISGQSGSATTSGLLRVSQGIYNIGITTGQSMTLAATSIINISGGAINVAGRFSGGTVASAFNYTQSGGTLTVVTAGNAATGNPSFGSVGGSTFNISGGTIILQSPATGATKFDYAAFGTANITGGTLQVGNASTAASAVFVLLGAAPNVVIDNSTTPRTARIDNNSLNILGNLTVNSGATLLQNSTGNVVIFGNATQVGNVVNNGTVSAIAASTASFVFGSASAQTVIGNALFTAANPIGTIGIQNGGTTFSIPVFANRLNLLFGNVTGGGNITLGNGVAAAVTVQVGVTGNATSGGTLDAAPVLNLGTGTYALIYAGETTPRTTGLEIPASRTVTSLLVTTLTNNVTLVGGDLTVTGTMTLTNGIVLTGTNTLIHNGTAARTNGFVVGNLSRSYAAVGAYTYFVGDNTGTAEYSPMTATVTALGINPSSLTVSVVDAVLSGLDPSQSASRYWTLTEGGDLTVNLAFTYVAADVAGTESTYKVYRREAGLTAPVPTTSTGTNPATATGITDFSDWGVGNLGPTAASVQVGGRVTTANGSGLRGALLTITDTHGISRNVTTSAFGYYRFDTVNAGETYLLKVAAKGYTFNQPAQALTVNDSLTGVNFTANR